MENDIIELFQRASEENDLVQKFRNVEVLITIIKIRHEIEAPFKKGYGGNIDVAKKLYMEGKSANCKTSQEN